MKAIIPIFHHDTTKSLYLQLYEYLKNSITKGEITEGEKLPSLRSLSKELSLSLTTITSAYQQLEVEGYIQSKPQSGYYVRHIPFLENTPQQKPDAEKKENISTVFSTENLNLSDSSFTQPSFQYDLSCFDFTKWKKCMAQVFTEHADLLMFESDPQGEPALRSELCRYLYSSRGVISMPSQVVIGAGTQQITGYLSLLLRKYGINHVAVEEPGYLPVQNIFRDRGFAVTPIPVNESGISIERLPANIRTAAYISPNNQFPTGAVTPVGHRYQLLGWALKNDSFLIEDDYDSELRYTGKPIPAMKSLDTDERVIYLGSFSSTLFPSIKISYMVLPEPLARIFHQIKNDYMQTCSKAEQLTLAIFMARGLYQINIKKLRNLYAQKLQRLLTAVSKYGRGFITPVNTASGINVTIQLHSKKAPEEIQRSAASLGIRVLPVKLKDAAVTQNDNIFILYYNCIPLDEIDANIRNLIQIWKH